MNFLEEQLQHKSLNTEQSILMGQWEFDKKNIPMALKAVSSIFPHYSLHDETHSLSILNNIVKILGKDTIEKLSCTDLWLILECAYSHDLGMVVTAERIHEVLSGDEFVKYFKKVTADKNHPSYSYTEHFVIEKNQLVIRKDVFSIDIIDSVKFLLADFFRSKHSEYSRKTVSNPKGVGIYSPRSIIPERLFEMLSKICDAHARNFDFVMSLPKDEDGIGLESCHPRFIACLLRLGDLLDIDNNRFSEALLKTINELPADSEWHRLKHKSISHLSIDTQSIEIEAVCQSPKVAQITQEWFDWINEEFKTQSLKWNSIVPTGLSCYLPTINFLRIKIKGYETLDGSMKPRFTIDTSKALELLQGKNFYNDAFDSIREILQNAVDSTLLRIYLEAKKHKKIFVEPDETFLNYASQFPIDVKLETLKNGDYEITISDNGVGLRKSQLTFLLNTGSSSKDTDKWMIIDEMPEWMKPSGVFGIGFQSIFLLTNKVDILTKDYFEDHKMGIELYSPNSKMKGDVYLKKVTEGRDVGLTIQFVVNNKIKLKGGKDKFDALPKGVEKTIVETKIRQYAKTSFVPITIIKTGEDSKEKIERIKFDYFDKGTNIELRFDEKQFDYSKNWSLNTYYRNANASSGIGNFLFLKPIVNIHSGSAKDMLTLDRGSFKEPGTIKKWIIETILKFLNSDKFTQFLSRLKNQEQAKTYFSFFVEYYELNGKLRDKTLLGNTLSFSFPIDGNNISISNIVNYPKIRFISVSNQVLRLERLNDNELKIETSLIPFGLAAFLSEIFKLMIKLAIKKHQRCFCKKREVVNYFEGANYVMTDKDDTEETELTIRDIVRNLTRGESRCYVNYVKGYDAIKLPTSSVDAQIQASYIGNIDMENGVEKILSPFVHINDSNYDCRNEAFYEYVAKETGTAIDQVVETYERFVADAKRNGLEVRKKTM